MNRVMLDMSGTYNGIGSQHVISGGFWVFGIRFVHQAFSILRLIILARILGPYDFGLMGIALLTMSTIDTFSQTGFQQALIQKKGDIRDYLDAAWTFLILRGVIITGIIFFAAPYSSDFFNAPDASLVIRVTGISMLFQSFANIGVIYFQKELNFKKQFIYIVGGSVADFSVAIIAVLIFGTVWALVLGLLAGSLVRLIVSFFIHPWRPKWDLDFSKARELFSFGKWILGSAILVFLVIHVDSIIVGAMIGVVALGVYQLAYTLASTPTTEIAHVIGHVTFPAYSKLQDSIPMLKLGYLRVLKTTSFFSFWLACFGFVLADDFTILFLGEKWASIIPVMRILMIAGAIRSVVATTGPIFVAVGKPRIDTSWQLLRFGVLIALVFPLTIQWGISGAAAAVLASISVSAIGFLSSTVRITGCGHAEFLRNISFPTILAATTASVMFLVKAVLQLSLLFEFPILVGVGVLVWLAATLALDRYMGYGMQPLLRVLVGSLRKKG